MKYIKKFEDKEESYFYRIRTGSYLICDITSCGKSERTFDIKFFDFAKNKHLIKILDLFEYDNIRTFATYFASVGDDVNKKLEHLLNNPTLRILVEDYDLFVDVLEVFNPDDIRVATKKYNL